MVLAPAIRKSFTCYACGEPGVLVAQPLNQHQGESAHRLRIEAHDAGCEVPPKVVASYLGFCPTCTRVMRARTPQVDIPLNSEGKVYYCASCRVEHDTFE